MDFRPLYEVMTVTEAAKVLGVSPRTARRYCDEGKLVARQSGDTWIISSQSVMMLKASKK